MTQTQLKIRYGLILQGVLGQALRKAGYSFAETPAYDADCEVPDFLIPDAKRPRFMVEVHQTEARDHFRMKTLRSVTAVAEGKSFFGPGVISVNVLFGDPDTEVPEANLKAMCGIFDVNVLLQRMAKGKDLRAIRRLETETLVLAGDATIPTVKAAAELSKGQAAAVGTLGNLLDEVLKGGKVKAVLQPMWRAEQKRRKALGESPSPGETTYYKKNMIRALFFEDMHLEAMIANPEADNWPGDVQRQVSATGVGEIVEEIDGDHLIVDDEFRRFLQDPDAPRLRTLCKNVLDSNESMKWFFEDIRDQERRVRMAHAFLGSLRKGLKGFEGDFAQCLARGSANGIEHTRCWYADLIPLCVRRSHNHFNRAMYSHTGYSLRLGNPFNNITIRSPRLGHDPDHIKVYRTVALDVFKEELASCADDAGLSMAEQELAERLLALRMIGAMRLQYLAPLALLVRAVSAQLGLTFLNETVASVLSDFAGVPAVGAFGFWKVMDDRTGRSVVLNAIAAEGNPRDKAKEWGARRLATLYRCGDDGFAESAVRNAVFVIDGTWAQSDLTRLFRSGWDRVVRMGDLESILRELLAL